MALGAGRARAPPLQLLGGPEDIKEVGLPGLHPGAGDALGALVRGFLPGLFPEPVPDGLQAVPLLAEPGAALLDVLVGPASRQLHDPHGQPPRPGLHAEAVHRLRGGRHGLLLLHLRNLGVRKKTRRPPHPSHNSLGVPKSPLGCSGHFAGDPVYGVGWDIRHFCDLIYNALRFVHTLGLKDSLQSTLGLEKNKSLGFQKGGTGGVCWGGQCRGAAGQATAPRNGCPGCPSRSCSACHAAPCHAPELPAPALPRPGPCGHLESELAGNQRHACHSAASNKSILTKTD